MARYQHPTYDTATAFAAACAAHRVNDGYIKEDVITWHDDGGHTVEKIANKRLIRQFLDGTYEIRDEDREFGERVRTHCHGLSFKIITGKTLSEFEQNMLSIADSDNIKGNYEVAVISSLPASYERAQVRNSQNVRLRETDGAMNVAVGSKIQTNIEVVRCNYSNNWDTFFVTGITNDNNVVFFAYRHKIEVGNHINIKGTVKTHKEDRTQLNRVKVI